MKNDDWAAAEDEFMSEERERLGGPPTPEEIAALMRGELSASEAARVRALCVYYPALTDVLLEKAPVEETVVVPREEVARTWESLRLRLDDAPHFSRKRRIVRTALPLAAMLAVGFFAGFITKSLKNDAPRAFDVPHELHPVAVRRGAAEARPHLLPASENDYLLVLMLGRETNYREYRVDLVDRETTPPRVIWRSSGVARVDDRPFTIAVPRTFVDPGVYELELYGLDGESHHLASYVVRVAS
jgi:hypothetical protein